MKITEFFYRNLGPKRRLTRCTHGNHPRVQDPLVLSVTVEVHCLLKPTLISQSFDLPFAVWSMPFPTGIAYENAMQPASMSHANPFYLPFYKCKSQGLFKCAVIQRRLSHLPLSQPALQIWSTDWNDVWFALTTYLVHLCDVVKAALIQFQPHPWASYCALLWTHTTSGKCCQVRDSHLHRCCLAGQTLSVPLLCRNSTAVKKKKKKTQPFEKNSSSVLIQFQELASYPLSLLY